MARISLPALAGAGVLALMASGFAVTPAAQAHWVQAPCDFVTAGGWVLKPNGFWGNFGVHAGCKHGEFWGHVNFVDHEFKFHLSSTRITGYLFDPAMPNARDICGYGRVNGQSQEVMFRVRVVENGEPGRGGDMFGIVVDNWYAPNRFYHVPTNGPIGGNVQLHKGNRSNSAGLGILGLQEWQMCGDLMHP